MSLRTVSDRLTPVIQERLYSGLQQRELLYSRTDSLIFGGGEARFLMFLDGTPGARFLRHSDAAPYRHVISMNVRKYVLAMQSFGKSWNVRALCCATIFSLLGCLLDGQLDEGTPEEKNSALRVLDWEKGCGRYLTGAAAGENSLAESLLTELGAFLQAIRSSSPEIYKDLLVQMQQAANAEYESISPSQTPKDSLYAADRSALFTFLGFKLAASGRLTRQEAQLCRLVGQVFRLVDDLCDIEEDADRGQINSILCKAKNEAELLHSIDKAFLELDRVLKLLDQGFSREFYRFLLYELRLWTLSNRYIFSRSLNHDH